VGGTASPVAPATRELKLDLGCGKGKRPGFIGVDSRAFDGVDQVVDLRGPWPWEAGSVREVYCSHFLEHLEAHERIHFANELYRILVPGGKATIVTPHWASNRAYGDLTHKWPPVSEMWFYYLSKAWRDREAPHTDFYLCDFETSWAYGLHQDILRKNEDERAFAVQEAALDMVAELTKK
jgi:SAM-dependent methyltransferase